MSEDLLPIAEKRVSLLVPMRRFGTRGLHSIYPVFTALGSICQAVMWSAIIFLTIIIISTLFPIGTPAGVFNLILSVLFCGSLLVAIFLPIYLRGTRLGMTNLGMHFPLCLTPALKNRLFRPWSDLEFADVHYGKTHENEVPGAILTLSFRTGGQADFRLARIPEPDMLQLQSELRAQLETNGAGLDQGNVSLAQSSVHPLSVVSDCVPRAALENLGSREFIVARGHRQILNRNFGLCQTNMSAVGDSICGGEYTVQKILGASDARIAYLVAAHNGQQFYLHEHDLSFLEKEKRGLCLKELEEMAARYARLEIEGLTRVVAGSIEDEKFFLITDFVKGLSLRDTVTETKTWKEMKALNMVRQVGETLERLHSADPSLCLGSLRPDVLIEQPADRRFFVAQVGFVNSLLTFHSNMLFHDCAYADLQQLRCLPTHSSDLYALGALLYFVLTGHDPQPVSVNHVRSIKPKLSRSIDELVARLMAPQPLDCSSLLYELGKVGEA